MINIDYLIQIPAAFVGSLGFALMLKIKGEQVIYAGIGGLFTWCIYLVSYEIIDSYYWSNFIAAVFVALYAEVMARVNKAPATIFLTAAAVPLIPGRNLYNMMYGIVKEDFVTAQYNGITAMVIALAIGLGFVSVAVFMKYLYRLNYFRRKKEIRFYKKKKD